MSKHTLWKFSVIFIFFGAIASTVWAQNGGFLLQKSLHSNGGGVSQGNGYILRGSVGQVAPAPNLKGNAFQLKGGFWGQIQPAVTPTATTTVEPTVTVEPTGTTTPEVTNTVEPDKAATITSPDKLLELQFPDGSVTETTRISTTTGTTTTTRPLPSLLKAIGTFKIEAFTLPGEAVKQFKKPYKLVYAYEDRDWQSQGVTDPNTLNLFWWNETTQRWVPILPCEGCLHDRANRKMIVYLDHLTEFALMGQVSRATYLPLIKK